MWAASGSPADLPRTEGRSVWTARQYTEQRLGMEAVRFLRPRAAPSEPVYGRGSRETALRSARALSVRPSSASSPTAWTAVPTISAPLAGAGFRFGALRAFGIPRGCAGCRSVLAVGRARALRRGV